MTYSGANTARESRESLGKALEALQQDADIPQDVMAVASNIAQAVGALFEAERASSEPDGKSCIKKALGTLSQTLALLQDVRSTHAGFELATETLAKAMSALYPLTTLPSRFPPPATADDTVRQSNPPGAGSPASPVAAAVAPAAPVSLRPKQQPASIAPVAPAPPSGMATQEIEVNIGASTESNFFVGFSGEIAQGGVFLSTYEVLPRGTKIKALVTLPGGFDFNCEGWVRFVRDPFDLNTDSEPGMGIQFNTLTTDARDLVLRFIRKRPPMFFDD